jgi:aryl-alcohol dehydrogenase-like predicted oxidoreductase
MNDLVRDGKSRYYGFSDTPAWYVARAQTLAEKEGKERPIALQLEYSLVERNIEREGERRHGEITQSNSRCHFIADPAPTTSTANTF